MMRNTFKWLLPVVLAGTFMAAPAAFALGRYEAAAVRNRVDRRQDRRALRRQGRRIVRQHRRLRHDVQRYGARSPQARIDRHQLRHTQHRFNRQARDLRHDRRQALRR
jgi:hypothetical protein